MRGSRDTADLVRLRHALLHAERLTVDSTEWGRHTALVALDGVCEYALGLGLAARNVTVKPTWRFLNLMDAMRSGLGASWMPPGRREILDLHRARNGAQHGGVLPDPALLPRWRDAVGVLIRSLIAGRSADTGGIGNSSHDGGG